MDRDQYGWMMAFLVSRRTGIWCVLVIGFALGDSTQVTAQSPTAEPATIKESMWNTLEGSEPWPTELIEVSELPEPDEMISQLVIGGNVAFKFYEADKIRRRFTGETRMAMRYHTDVKYRWRVVRFRNKRQLAVTVDHRPTRFEFFHEILLPREHAHAQIFGVPLVLHELDHVRISLDPRYQAQFEEWFQEATKSLTIDVAAGTTEDEFDALIQGEVQAKSVQCFEKVLQLIHVRNRELDRQTQHGRLKLDDDFFGAARVQDE
jgi:hypothetical protein